MRARPLWRSRRGGGAGAVPRRMKGERAAGGANEVKRRHANGEHSEP
ncbi:hypothetical protein [Halococcus sediminicola]|nr:hypothetical protein [Halococcus sediminicola]